MLISKKVLDFNEERKRIITKRVEENKAMSNCLNPVSRLFFNRLNSVISDLGSVIEQKSGFTYTPDYFMYKSDYTYNSGTNEIIFNVTRLDIANPDSSELSNRFLTNYEEELTKLAKLEQKRSKIIKPYQDSYNRFVIDFNKAVEQRKEKENKEKDLDFLSITSQEFISKFGIDGVKRLISLLNTLTTTNIVSPLVIYNMQFYGNVTSRYVDELFRWAASFTPRAQYVRDYIERERMEKESILLPETKKSF